MKVVMLIKRDKSLSFGQFRASLENKAKYLIAPFAKDLSRYKHNYPDIHAWCSPYGMTEAPYDCIIELWFVRQAGFQRLKDLCCDRARRFNDWAEISSLIDHGQTMCFVVTECNSSAEPAAGRVKGMSFHSRRSHLTRAQFRAYYETHHTPLVSSLFKIPRRYQRNYPDPANACLPEGMTDTPFDSVTQAWYDDLEIMERFRAAIADTKILARLKQDEENFLDGSKSILFQVDEIEHPIAID